MKRKRINLMIMAVCTISAVMGWSYYSSRTNQESLLLKENVEALSDDDSESKKYRAYKCYIKEAQRGTSGYICPPGTNPPIFYSCPSETKTVNIMSTTSSCIKEER